MLEQSAKLNQDFFDSIYKEIWKGIIPPGLSEAEAEFIRKECGLEEGARVLDLMCGYGRHAIELARAGVEVHAIDSLRDYISEIGERANQDLLPIKAEIASVIDFQPEGFYDAAICMGNSFAFLNREEAIGLLKKVSNHLKPGGKFIINTWMIAEIAIRHFKEKEWYEVGNYKYLLDYKFHFHPNRIESEQTIIEADRVVDTLKGIDYVYTLDELEQMFQEAGLKTAAVYASPKGRLFKMGDNKAYIIYEKSIT